MGTDAAIMVATRPGSPPPADTQDQIREHDSWCYQTMGNPQCYAHIQDVPPERLINVDPQNLYPLDVQTYRQAVNDKPAAPGTAPASLSPAPSVGVEKTELKEDSGAAAPLASTLDSNGKAR